MQKDRANGIILPNSTSRLRRLVGKHLRGVREPLCVSPIRTQSAERRPYIAANLPRRLAQELDLVGLLLLRLKIRPHEPIRRRHVSEFVETPGIIQVP